MPIESDWETFAQKAEDEIRRARDLRRDDIDVQLKLQDEALRSALDCLNSTIAEHTSEMDARVRMLQQAADAATRKGGLA